MPEARLGTDRASLFPWFACTVAPYSHFSVCWNLLFQIPDFRFGHKCEETRPKRSCSMRGHVWERGQIVECEGICKIRPQHSPTRRQIACLCGRSYSEMGGDSHIPPCGMWLVGYNRCMRRRGRQHLVGAWLTGRARGTLPWVGIGSLPLEAGKQGGNRFCVRWPPTFQGGQSWFPPQGVLVSLVQSPRLLTAEGMAAGWMAAQLTDCRQQFDIEVHA
jgi:hypothetical protein